MASDEAALRNELKQVEDLIQRTRSSAAGIHQEIRQFHRWMSITFTVTVIVVFAALAQEEPIVWVSYIPLFPLALLLVTGLYMFVLPYVTGSGKERATG